MSNGHFDAQARYAALDERVTNLRTSMVNLEGEMRSGFTTINSHLTSMSTEMRSSQRTHWPVIWSAIGVSFAILIAVGSQALSPIRDSVTELKTAEQAAVDKMVTRDELDARSARGSEDRARTEAALIDLRTTMVTRNEWMERNGSRDHQIEAIEREINDLKTASAATYNVRDVILDLRERLDRLEHERSSTMMPR